MPRPFENFQRLLWPVLGALARRGYVVQPSDARDLIQDFYVDQWMLLDQHYDPSRGPFERYLFGAFYRYARRRIARLHLQQSRMLEIGFALSLSNGEVPADQALDDTARALDMRRALARLPESQRTVLESYLGGASENERDTARLLGITRYRLRETLTDAVGRLATELDALKPVGAVEKNVAVALWRDGRPVPEVAARLGMSVAEVHVVRKRIVNHLLNALQRTPTRKTSRREDMSESEMNATKSPLDVLRRALVSERDPALLRQVRDRASEIIAALDEEDEVFSESEREAMSRDPRWLAEVYEVLGADDHVDEDEAEAEIEASIELIHLNEDREIAEAFDVLTDTLPHDFTEWHEWFGKVPEVSPETQSILVQRWDELKAGKHAPGLIRYGITPAALFEATVGVSLLLDRMAAASPGTDDTFDLMLRPGASNPSPGCAFGVTLSQLLAQMRASPECPPEATQPVLYWICAAAELRPYLFDGFRVCGRSENGLKIVSDFRNANLEILRRWSPATLSSMTSEWTEYAAAAQAELHSTKY